MFFKVYMKFYVLYYCISPFCLVVILWSLVHSCYIIMLISSSIITRARTVICWILPQTDLGKKIFLKTWSHGKKKEIRRRRRTMQCLTKIIIWTLSKCPFGWKWSQHYFGWIYNGCSMSTTELKAAVISNNICENQWFWDK